MWDHRTTVTRHHGCHPADGRALVTGGARLENARQHGETGGALLGQVRGDLVLHGRRHGHIAPENVPSERVWAAEYDRRRLRGEPVRLGDQKRSVHARRQDASCERVREVLSCAHDEPLEREPVVEPVLDDDVRRLPPVVAAKTQRDRIRRERRHGRFDRLRYRARPPR